MSKLAIIGLCLLWPSVVCAGQATAQFHVGITITGKRSSTTPASGGAPAVPAAGIAPKSSLAYAAYPTRARQCASKFRSYSLVTRTYIGRDGSIHRCP